MCESGMESGLYGFGKTGRRLDECEASGNTSRRVFESGMDGFFSVSSSESEPEPDAGSFLRGGGMEPRGTVLVGGGSGAEGSADVSALILVDGTPKPSPVIGVGSEVVERVPRVYVEVGVSPNAAKALFTG